MADFALLLTSFIFLMLFIKRMKGKIGKISKIKRIKLIMCIKALPIFIFIYLYFFNFSLKCQARLLIICSSNLISFAPMKCILRWAIYFLLALYISNRFTITVYTSYYCCSLFISTSVKSNML